MEGFISLEQQLNIITVEILEVLDIYPSINTTDIIENVLFKYVDKVSSYKNNKHEVKSITPKFSVTFTHL